MRQINYNTAPLKFSDHRPVYATFLCMIMMVDEKKKEKLSRELYEHRRGFIGNSTATGQADDSEEEDLIGYDPIEPTLPPASSDRRKWWLDNGQPAKSDLRSPGNDFVANPKRPSNPWAPSQEPDWVKVMAQKNERTNNIHRQPSDAKSTTSIRRKLPPPLEPSRVSSPVSSVRSMPANHVPALPPRRAATTDLDGGVESRDLVVGLNRSSSSASTGSANSIKRKPAPPIPKKPSVLAGSTSPKSEKKQQPPSLPPPRRTGTGKPPGATVARECDGPPSLPPRRETALLDETEKDDMQGLKHWEVLRPA